MSDRVRFKLDTTRDGIELTFTNPGLTYRVERKRRGLRRLWAWLRHLPPEYEDVSLYTQNLNVRGVAYIVNDECEVHQ